MSDSASNSAPATATPDLLMVGAKRAALLCGLSERQWWRMRDAGEIPKAIQIGRRMLWSVQELRDWIAAGCPSRERWESTRRTA